MSDTIAGSDSGLPVESLYRDIVENCADAIVVVSADQTIIHVNEATSATFGYSREDLIGKPLDILIPQRFRTAHSDLFSAFRNSGERAKFKGRSDVAVVGLRADLTEFPVSVSILKSGSGAHMALVAIIRDISAQKSLEQELRKLASLDSLTGILNRRAFLSRAKEECARARRYARPMSLALADIDHFKRVNDRFGHNAGDRAICAVVDTIASGLRTSDVFGRWGGEEFMMILPETGIESAAKTMQRLRRDIADARLDLGGSGQPPYRLTVSMGLTAYIPGEDTIDALIKRADDALYRAKQTGRNKVCVSAEHGRQTEAA